MSWHVESTTIEAYQRGAVDRVVAASLEAHLTRCARCRSLIEVDPGWLERSWSSIAERVEPSPPGLLERILAAAGVRAHVARLVAVSPALRVSFLLAVVMVVAFATAASRSVPEDDAYRIFLVVAPLLPVVGVAMAYGRLVDRAHELTVSAPIDSFHLLLLRSVTVLTVSILLGLIAWPLVPAPLGLGIWAWLVPALALTLLTLALASHFEIWLSGALVSAGWVAAAVLSVDSRIDLFDSRAQTVLAAIACLAGLVVVARRASYDREGRHR